MDERLIFAVLGIEKTDDEEAIRTAYRNRLVHTNPEDDPEGFKRLRTAYEEALQLLHRQDEESEAEEDNTPPGLWMKRVEKVYSSISRRLDEEEWKLLLNDDICLDLEYGEQVKWRLFVYLASHFYMTSRIYQILDSFFHIEEEEEKFKEHLPVGFVDYMIQRINDTEGQRDFEFELFEGADDADYDEFINYYRDLQEQVYNKDGAAALQTVAAMETMNISHPHMELEHARAQVLCGNKEKAMEIARPLMKEYPDDLRIQLFGNEILYQCGCEDEAAQGFERYSEEKYYLSEKYLSEYAMSKNELSSAIMHCLNAMRSERSEELEERLKTMDAAYILLTEKQLEEGREEFTLDEKKCIIGAYSRMDDPAKALELFDRFPEWEEDMTDCYHSYKGRLYLQLERPNEAIEEFRKWKEQLGQAEEPDEGDLARVHSYEGEAWHIIGVNNKDSEAFKKAEEEFEEAFRHNPRDLNYKQRVLDIYITTKRYEEAINIADDIIKKDAGWFPAYVQRQKANSELGHAQKVIDDFYAAKDIYGGYAQIYELATEVFLDYSQLKDAENIFAQAKDAEVESDMLDVLDLRYRRMRYRKQRSDGELSDNAAEKERKKLYKLAGVLEGRFKRNKPDDETASAFYKEMGFLLKSVPDTVKGTDYRGIIRYFKKAIASLDEAWTHFLLGRALRENGSYEEAISEYKIYEEREGSSYDELYINMGSCYRSMGKREEAIEAYKKALEVNPQNDEANGSIAAIYRNMLNDTGNKYYAEIAQKYAETQRALTPDDPWFLRELGFLYLEWGNPEAAEKDAKRSLELEPDNPYGWNLMGEVYRGLGQLEEAIKCYRKAIEKTDAFESFRAPYVNMGDCYNRLGRYKEALNVFREALEHEPIRRVSGSREVLYNRMVRLCRRTRQFDEANRILEEFRAAGPLSDEDYDEHKYFTERERGDKDNAYYMKRCQEMADKYDSIDCLDRLADFYICEMEDIDKAIEILKKAFAKAKEQDEVWDERGILLSLMSCYYKKGDASKVDEYARIYWEELEKEYSYNPDVPADVQYMDHIYDAPENTQEIAKYWLYKGDVQKARELMKNMSSDNLCKYCTYNECTDYLYVMGMILEAEGDIEGAVAMYRRVLKTNPSSQYSRYKIRKLDKNADCSKAGGKKNMLRGIINTIRK